MLRTRHVVLLSMAGLSLLACAKRQEQEPASPSSVEQQQAPAEQPGYGSPPPPQGQPMPPATAPTAGAAPGGGDMLKSKDEAEFTSLSEAEAALEKARGELGGPRADARPAEPPQAAKPAKPEKKSSGAEGLAAGTDRCVNACKAFASLKRAASAVCRLAGESNARCKRAQGIVQESETRIAVCKCAQNGE